MVKQKNKKAAVVDPSFYHPIQFSVSGGDLIQKDIDSFLDNLNVDFYASSQGIHEFNASYATQTSLFAKPINKLNCGAILANEAIYLSDSGDFSLTAPESFPITICDSKPNQSQPTIWQSSFQWRERLSFEDKNAIFLASSLTNIYEGVAILTNDWALRRQCTDHEGIDVYGTCYMLAGLVLNDIISYQKGTFIYKTWYVKEPRWVPTNLLGKRKWTFKEVLDFERRRTQQGKSFWINS